MTNMPDQEEQVRVLATQLLVDDEAYNNLASKYLVDGKPSGVLSINEMDDQEIVEINAFAVAYAQRNDDIEGFQGIMVVEDDKDKLRGD